MLAHDKCFEIQYNIPVTELHFCALAKVKHQRPSCRSQQHLTIVSAEHIITDKFKLST
jgi:hypothetical protein